MKDFLEKTYWLWVVFKILLIMILLIESIHLLNSQESKSTSTIIYASILIESILLTVTLIHDFSTVTLKYLKIATGILLILGGIVSFVAVITNSIEGMTSFTFLWYFIMSIIIVMIGIFDIYYLDKPYGKYD